MKSVALMIFFAFLGLAVGLFVGGYACKGSPLQEEKKVNPVSDEKRLKDEIGVLIGGLTSANIDERIFCSKRLSELTGLFFDYNPTASEEERNEGVRRWRIWWDKAKERSPDEWLSDALKDKNYHYRAQAAFILGRRGQKSGIPALKEALKDDDMRVREAAVFALGMLNDETSVSELSELAVNDLEPSVRIAAVNALAAVGSKGWDSLSSIADKLKDVPTLFVAADALGVSNNRERLVVVLGRLLDTSDRVAVQFALKRIGERQITELKVRVKELENTVTDETTKRLIEKTLERLGEKKQ